MHKGYSAYLHVCLSVCVCVCVCVSLHLLQKMVFHLFEIGSFVQKQLSALTALYHTSHGHAKFKVHFRAIIIAQVYGQIKLSVMKRQM